MKKARKRGRKPLGKVAMTAAERQRRWRAKRLLSPAPDVEQAFVQATKATQAIRLAVARSEALIHDVATVRRLMGLLTAFRREADKAVEFTTWQMGRMLNTLPPPAKPDFSERLSSPRTWTPKREARLRRLWEAGAHWSAICAELGISREQMFGKSHTLGLGRRYVRARSGYRHQVLGESAGGRGGAPGGNT
jgi:hypothetical protein